MQLMPLRAVAIGDGIPGGCIDEHGEVDPGTERAVLLLADGGEIFPELQSMPVPSSASRSLGFVSRSARNFPIFFDKSRLEPILVKSSEARGEERQPMPMNFWLADSPWAG